MKIKKTNAMRILDQKKIPYTTHAYDKDKIEFDGIDVATQIGQPASKIFKTIVLEHGVDHFVAVIPINEHIDMKKAAKAFGVKRLELLHIKYLFDLTGYVRGGCSPLGMKKQFPTIIDTTAQAMSSFIVSAGKIGQQLEVNPTALLALIRGNFADVVVSTSEDEVDSVTNGYAHEV
ncbi:Cys-tRNA(Pro) deacylase [Erysipelothrix sp. HDW6C]|uniref:Cys-tRNA(Pro) deacylase n=1 Tax=Erysipelothrix sp. HDW6C TaxID=2714930 RepID=UPI001F101864|nr:Cys-tRNA(Pro) deacylase [Erysipelothrix sp. HDW6C]